ncbi:hypothetical protein Dimus_022195 [Dionaea muscipula]
MHIATCKEFYKNLTVTITKKKEVARTSVKGVKIELDGRILAGILGVLGNNGICEYIKEIGVIRRRDDEDEAPAENEENVEVNEGEEVQQDFDWEEVIDEVELQEEEVHDEAEIHGESGSAKKFYDLEDEVQGSADMVDEVPEVLAPVPEQQKETATAGVDPSIPVGSISDSDFAKFQAEFDRARADSLQAELDRARAENARLQALLQQAKSQPKP